MLLAKKNFEFHARVQKCHFGNFSFLHIKSAWFLLELAMALVTTIGMRFLQVCPPYRDDIVYGWPLSK